MKPAMAGGGRTGAGTVPRPLRLLERARPGSRVIHVLPGNARQHHARAPVPFLERPDCRVRLRFLPPYAPHLNPTGRLWGVMHRHVRRNRFHADLRQFTGAIFRFFDGTRPREREAIAESVTDSFRVITHDGYRMAACAAAVMRRRANQAGKYGPVQFSEYNTESFDGNALVLNICNSSRRMVVAVCDLQVFCCYRPMIDQVVNDCARSLRSHLCAQFKDFRMHPIRHDGRKP